LYSSSDHLDGFHSPSQANTAAQILKNSAQALTNPGQIPNVSPTAAPKYDSGHSLWINQALESMNQVFVFTS
jgi:hypothetical protein